MRLQVSQELDKLNGAFRKKENEIIAPIVNRYSAMEQKLDLLTKNYESLQARTSEQENSMLVQEKTVGLIIDFLSTIQ